MLFGSVLLRKMPSAPPSPRKPSMKEKEKANHAAQAEAHAEALAKAQFIYNFLTASDFEGQL